MAPKTKEQNEAIRAQAKQAIMQAGLELFAKKGFASTSISAIAKQAGVSKGLMYNYFESKEKLLEGIVFGAIDTGEGFMMDVINTELPAKVRFKNLVEGTITLLTSNFEYWKLMASLSFQTDALQGFEDIIRQKTEGHIAMGTSLFADMGYANPKMEAMLFGAIVDGILVHNIHMDNYPIQEIKQFLFEKYEL